MITKRAFLCFVTLLFSAVLPLPAAAKKDAKQADLPKPSQVIEYKKVGDTALHLHIFNPPDHKASDKRPTIVFFFGGGWVGGSPQQFFGQCGYLSSRGMVAISAEYRTQKANGTSPQECVKDGKSAIRWVRGHAAELGIDPEKIAAGGGSAGGHVAAATGTLKGFNEPGENTDVSCRPNALVLFNPVFDNGPKGYGYERVKDYWKEFSPIDNIDAKTPPTVVFLGTSDKLIPVETGKRVQQLMKDAGVRCDLHLYDGQPHGFFNKAKYAETLIEADKFLASLGYLKGEPTLPAGEK
jgi:acetyl esterase/lipase